MTKIELLIIDNYLEWVEIPVKRKLKLKLNALKGKYLFKQFMKEKKISYEEAKKEIARLILSVVYGERMENIENNITFDEHTKVIVKEAK